MNASCTGRGRATSTQGFLTGTISADNVFEANDFRAGNPRFQRPGTRRPERVAENAAAAHLVLPEEERKVLDDLPTPTGARY